MKKHDPSARRIIFTSYKLGEPIIVTTDLEYNYAQMLERDISVKRFETMVPLTDWKERIQLKGIRTQYRKMEWLTDFRITYKRGNISIRELVKQSDLASRAVIEKLELSRRYWEAVGITDWKIVVEVNR